MVSFAFCFLLSTLVPFCPEVTIVTIITIRNGTFAFKFCFPLSWGMKGKVTIVTIRNGLMVEVLI
jgi:hypothetical protein